jgi:hypothetical protein
MSYDEQVAQRTEVTRMQAVGNGAVGQRPIRNGGRT